MRKEAIETSPPSHGSVNTCAVKTQDFAFGNDMYVLTSRDTRR
jgi:hypothetical protein